jgi:hypothetical protein
MGVAQGGSHNGVPKWFPRRGSQKVRPIMGAHRGGSPVRSPMGSCKVLQQGGSACCSPKWVPQLGFSSGPRNFVGHPGAVHHRDPQGMSPTSPPMGFAQRGVPQGRHPTVVPQGGSSRGYPGVVPPRGYPRRVPQAPSASGSPRRFPQESTSMGSLKRVHPGGPQRGSRKGGTQWVSPQGGPGRRFPKGVLLCPPIGFPQSRSLKGFPEGGSPNGCLQDGSL